MKKITPLLGWIGLSIGILVAITSFLPGNFAKIAFIGMLPGFLCSSAYVLFSTRYQLQQKGFNPGITGMLLNSTPFAIILYMQLTK
jgi:hypothetical protein